MIVLVVCLVIVVGAVLAARNAKNKQLDNAYNEQKVFLYHNSKTY